MSKKSGSGAKKNGTGPDNAAAAAEAVSVAKSKPGRPERWGDEPDEHDYPAAASFLSLICDPTEVRRLVTALKAAPIVHYKAKDLLRASALALLPADNFHVAGDLAKVARGQPLSPVLLMRGDFRRGVPLTIAGGYHRVCASYHLDEDADIPCHLVDHKGPTAVPGFRLGSGVDAGTGPDGGGGPGVVTGTGTPAGAGSGSGTGSPGGPRPQGASSRPVA